MIRKFDLNIERILDNWELKHAVREIIANAIDEQKLSGTSDIQIFKRNGEWIVKDFGRGLKYEDFTQNENNEKLSAKGIIGRFGIGLKDALATFDRNQVSVLILSKYGKITLGRSHKNGFDDVVTLHAYIDDPIDKNMVGTEFHLKNIPDEAIENAKKLFLKFNDYQIVGRTKYGDIIENSGYYSKIYVNGVLVATEDNFLFSYNITSINTQLKKSMNRERTNVGRTAYASIVRAMLLECKDEKVAEELSNDFKGYSYGNTHDELKWIDVQRHAVQIMNEKHNAIFVTSKNIQENNDLVTEARDGGENHNGSDIIVIPENLYNKLSDDNESKPEEQKVRTFDQFVTERSNNFEYKFISDKDLTPQEKSIFNLKDKILSYIDHDTSIIKEILISETMVKDPLTYYDAVGLWVKEDSRIIIKRSVLQDKEHFCGTLLHEIAHATSGYTDATRPFESELTHFLGIVASHAL